MASKAKTPRLGRGLSALMAQAVRVSPPEVSESETVAPKVQAATSTPKSVDSRLEKNKKKKAPSTAKTDEKISSIRERATGTDSSTPSGSTDQTAARQATSPQANSHKAQFVDSQASQGDGSSADERENFGAGGIVYLSPSMIRPNPHQPRRRFEPEALQRLADSILTAGLMQPIIVRPRKTGAPGRGGTFSDGITHEIVAGERRWRAVQLAGLQTLPVIVRDLDEHQTAEWALVENLQREDLNPMERAEAFAHLIQQFQLSHDQIAQRVGVERSTISNLLRLIDLDIQVQDWVRLGKLGVGHARALVTIASREQQQAIAQKIITQALSVRQVEQLVKGLQNDADAEGQDTPQNKLKPQARAAHLADLEEQIGRQLSTKVRIRPGRRKGSGTMSIDFYSVDQFDTLLKRLEVEAD